MRIGSAVPWGALLVALLAASGCSMKYDAAAACGSLSDLAPVRDASVDQLQASHDGGRCAFRMTGRDPAALQRQQRMLDSISVIACGQPAQIQPIQGAQGFELQMPSRCPLSARTSLFARDDPRWRLERPSMPSYPAVARGENLQGKVSMRLLLDDEGRVKAAIVAESSGHPLLDEAAVKAALGWQWKREWWAFSATRMSMVPATTTFAGD